MDKEKCDFPAISSLYKPCGFCKPALELLAKLKAHLSIHGLTLKGVSALTNAPIEFPMDRHSLEIFCDNCQNKGYVLTEEGKHAVSLYLAQNR